MLEAAAHRRGMEGECAGCPAGGRPAGKQEGGISHFYRKEKPGGCAVRMGRGRCLRGKGAWTMKKYAAGMLVCLALFFACLRLPAVHAQQGSGSCQVTAVVGQPDPTREPEDGDSSNQSSAQEPEGGNSGSPSDIQEPEDGGSGKPLSTEGSEGRGSGKPLPTDEPGEGTADSVPEDSAATPEPSEGMPGQEDGQEPSEEMPDPGDKRKPGGEAGAGIEPTRQPDPSREPVSVQEGVSDGTGSGCKCFCRFCLPAAVLMVLCSLILMAVGRKRAAGKGEMRH